MENEIARAVESYDSGRMTRRELVKHLAALAVVFGAAGRSSSSAAESSTFEGVGLNHIALRVTDVPKSRDFYVKHLGLSVNESCGEQSCFLDCGDQFVALFRAERPGMHHYCYSIKNFDLAVAEEKLIAQGIEPRVHR
jgi:hypothetical protein